MDTNSHVQNKRLIGFSLSSHLYTAPKLNLYISTALRTNLFQHVKKLTKFQLYCHFDDLDDKYKETLSNKSSYQSISSTTFRQQREHLCFRRKLCGQRVQRAWHKELKNLQTVQIHIIRITFTVKENTYQKTFTGKVNDVVQSSTGWK